MFTVKGDNKVPLNQETAVLFIGCCCRRSCWRFIYPSASDNSEERKGKKHVRVKHVEDFDFAANSLFLVCKQEVVFLEFFPGKLATCLKNFTRKQQELGFRSQLETHA